MRLEEPQLATPAANGVLVRGTWQKHVLTRWSSVLLALVAGRTKKQERAPFCTSFSINSIRNSRRMHESTGGQHERFAQNTRGGSKMQPDTALEKIHGTPQTF